MLFRQLKFVIDAMFSNYIPMYLMSKDFFNKIKTKNAVLALNVAINHPSYLSYMATLYNVFGDNLYFIKGPRNSSMNLVFVSTFGANHVLNLPQKYYQDYLIEKLIINNEILSSKIFTIAV